jgi:hypothetical protein
VPGLEFGHLQKVMWPGNLCPEGARGLGSQIWVTLLSQYLGYTLSQHLGDSFCFATRGQRPADIVAPAKSFFLAFYALPFPEPQSDAP